MDKFEYNVRASEIKELIKEGNYVKAADIADTIDWRRVKSIMMLCTISDVYKINRRYVESRDILLYAYERNPNGRLILYYLCELSIKLGDIVSALEYYKRFAQIAPKDASQFILLYKIYEAQDATLEERINVLEELKRRDYKEKWAFELAYLYHLVGQTSLCIEECDEIFLWFAKGKYVTKALELKQLHVPLPDDQAARLNESQQADIHYEPDNIDGVDYYDENDSDELDKDERYNGGLDRDKTYSDGLDKNKRYRDESDRDEIDRYESNGDEVYNDESEENLEWEDISHFDEMFFADGMNEEDEDESDDDMDIRIRPVDVSEYNTINLQQEIAENMRELLSDNEEFEVEEYFSDDNFSEESDEGAEETEEEDEVVDEYINIVSDISTQIEQGLKAEMKKGISETGVIKAFNKTSSYDDMLSQGYDGQISLVVPDEQKVEKQITGQLKIDDILTEWERQKKEIEQKRKAEVRSKIQEQTATLFNDFDTQTKMGLLEKLEKAMVDAAIKAGPSVIKVADIGTEGKANEAGLLVQEPEDEEIKRILDTEDKINNEEIDTGEILENEIEEDEEIESLDEESSDNENDIDEEFSIDDENDTNEEFSVDDETGIDEELSLDNETGIEEISADDDTDIDTELASQKPEEINAAIPNDVNKEPKAEKPATDDVRNFTPEEKSRFGRFVQHKKIRRQLVTTLDNIKEFDGPSHIIVTGEESLANMKVVKGIIKEVKDKSGELHGKVIKISGTTLNKKGVAATFTYLTTGIIIIEHAADMKKASVNDLTKIINEPENKLMVILEDNRSAIDELMASEIEFAKIFPNRVDLNALDNKSLVEYAKNYAFAQEYSIDEFGILALHTRIAEMQTSDHEVTTAEVEEIIEEAIYYAGRKNPKHFFDILAGKRYDEEDMIVLREKDFLH